MVWGSVWIVGLLGVAYLAFGGYVVVSCGRSPVPQAGAALGPPSVQTLADVHGSPRAPAVSWPLLIGHSGSTYWCRRNTLGCFATSLALGATMLEVDVRLSADGVLVAFHDADVDHQTDGAGAVRALTWAQLRALQVGRDFAPPAGVADAPLPLQSRQIALLDDVRQAFPAIPLLLDIKAPEPPMEAALVAFVQRFEASDFARIYIKTRNQRLAKQLRRLPQPPMTGLTRCERIAFVAFPGLVTSPPGLLDLPLWLVSPAIVHRATAAGHRVVVSLINEAHDLRTVLALQGLFGVVTDRPDLALQAVSTPSPSVHPRPSHAHH